jgi:hypothetical protein
MKFNAPVLPTVTHRPPCLHKLEARGRFQNGSARVLCIAGSRGLLHGARGTATELRASEPTTCIDRRSSNRGRCFISTLARDRRMAVRMVSLGQSDKLTRFGIVSSIDRIAIGRAVCRM